MCNHETLANPPPLDRSNVAARSSKFGSNGSSNGHALPADQSTARPERPEPISREMQLTLRREACETAVANDRERIAEGLYDSVIHRLFAAGLQLQATCQHVDESAQHRIETTIDLLDASIAELRKAIFSLH